MYHITGFDREEIIDLCIRINSAEQKTGSPNWPPCLGLFKSVVAALTYMRHNRTQADIGESLSVSQPTISRAISAITPLIPEAVREFVLTADDLDPDTQYILDGTLLPCWSWAGHTELYSGKHKTTGMNVQVACTTYGKLAWISDPVNGSRHDNYCQEESGVLLTMNPKNWIGDKGYIGNNMITPYRKPAGSELLDWQKEYNSQVNKIRWMIEQVISHFKNWTIMHTDYRRLLKTFATTISSAVGLHFYRTAYTLNMTRLVKRAGDKRYSASKYATAGASAYLADRQQTAALAHTGAARRVSGPAPPPAWADVSGPFRLRDPDLTHTSCGRGQDHYGSTP